jgi:hypothetical protein
VLKSFAVLENLDAEVGSSSGIYEYNGGMHPVVHVSIKYQGTYVRNKY